MEITGKLIEVGETQQISDRFRKREFVVEYATNPEYPEFVKMELTQDRVGLLDNFTTGQSVQVSFDLRGRKWVAPDGAVKYFNTIQAWRLQDAGGAQQAADTPPPIQDSVAEEVPF